jgi:hypothetical protein
MPALKHVPEWMPGAGFKKLTREWCALLLRLRDEPYQETLKVIICVTFPAVFLELTHREGDNIALEYFDLKSLARHNDRPYELQAQHDTAHRGNICE